MKTSTLATALAVVLIGTALGLGVSVTTMFAATNSFAQQPPKGGCGGNGDPKCLGPRGLNDAAIYRFEEMLAGCPDRASSKKADEIRRLLNQPVDGTWNSRIDKADEFASKCNKK